MDKIKIAVPAELTKITISNPWVEEEEVALTPENGLWNTGLSAAREPHADELILAADYVGKGLIPDSEEWKARHIASVQMFRTNQYLYLMPGDSYEFIPDSKEEAVYYSTLPQSEILKIEQSYVTVVEEDGGETTGDNTQTTGGETTGGGTTGGETTTP